MLGLPSTPDGSVIARYDRAIRIDPIQPGRFLLDFGCATFGTLHAPGSLRAFLTVHLGERLDGGRVHRKPGGSVRYERVAWDARRDAVLPLPRPTQGRSVPPGLPEVVPFRYVELEGIETRRQANAIRRITLEAPFDEQAGAFECSDPWLNRVWGLCRHTVRSTTFLGIYIDGDRERIPYEGDTYVNQLSHYAVDTNHAVARRTIDDLMASPTWPTEWHLLMPLVVWHDVLYTGDLEAAASHYAALHAKTLLALAKPDGLISTRRPPPSPDLLEAIGLGRDFPSRPDFGFRDLVDWPAGERDDYEFRDINTVVNACHAASLRAMACLAGVLGRPDEAWGYARRAVTVRRALHRVLYDAEVGLYRDGEGSDHHALHASAFPLALGLVPRGLAHAIADRVARRGMACSVYAAQFLLDALFDHGQTDAAVRLMTDPDSLRSWPQMIHRLDCTMTPEAWGPEDKPNLDYNHAWATAPLNVIARKVLGVTPMSPGFRAIRFQPRLGTLRWAHGRVPTPHGPIEVDLEHTDGGVRSLLRLPPSIAVAGR